MRPHAPGTPRRVLFVNHEGGVSGAELSLLGLLAKLDRRRFVGAVACPRGELARRLRPLGVPHVPLRLSRLRRAGPVRTLRDLARLVPAVLRLTGIVRGHAVELVHANSTTAFLSAAPAAKLARVPVVWHVRDLVGLGRAGKLLFRMADAVACVSEAVQRHLIPSGGDLDKLWTVTNGIDLDAFRRAARPGTVRAGLGIAPDAPVVTQISQITPWKGHRFLLDALVRVRSEFPRLRVLFVGEPMTPEDAKYREALEARAAELGLANTVTFTGWRDDVASVIADSDVVALPSRAEPFGRAALEALALGKPVVGTRAGALPELVTHRRTGFLVDFGDTDALADALVTLLGSPDLRAEMGRNAAVEAAPFDITRTVNQLQNLYDDLLAR
ncbi:MAG TPA: glycosyltransferase family 4 protein [Planctomycetota bacterium]|nr:glycosyltransferase family 4 protein [Planctomycetota bacterium]